MRWLLLSAASVASALLAQWARVPAAWLIGPMVVAIVFAVAGGSLRLPKDSMAAAQGVVGIAIAQSFSMPILVELAHEWAPIAAVVAATLVAATSAGWLLARFSPLSPETAAWGSSPGAAAAMTSLSAEFGADARIVAFMQYLRVTLVVLTASLVSRVLLADEPLPVAATSVAEPFVPLPFLLTLVFALGAAFGGRALRIPGGQFLGPLIGGAALHTSGWLPIDVPWWLLALAYVAIAWNIGLLYTPETLRFVLRMLPTLLLSTGVLLALCALSGGLLALLLHVDPLTAYLATTPGGLDSVSIIALGTGSNLALILAIQTLRLFAVVVSGPPLAKLIARLAQPRSELAARVGEGRQDRECDRLGAQDARAQ